MISYHDDTNFTSGSYPKSKSPWLIMYFSTYSMPQGIAKNKTLICKFYFNKSQELKAGKKFTKNAPKKYYPATSYLKGAWAAKN